MSPTTWVALLRALNVGGRAVVKMTDVRQAFETAGCRDVKTLGHAGNIVFTCGAKNIESQQKKILQAMHTLMGARTDMCFRRLEELASLVAHPPFGDLVFDESVKLYVAFMDREPQPAPKLPIMLPKEALEITSLRGRDMFIVSRRKPDGRYGFPNQLVEKLGVVATSRNWNTVVKLAALQGR